MAEPLALSLGLICDSLMADLSPPSTSGVLVAQGRAPWPLGFVLSPAQPCSRLCKCLWAREIREIWTLLGSRGSCQVPPAPPARSAESGSRQKRAGLRRCSRLGLNFCLCYRRQHLCPGQGDSFPTPRGFRVVTLRTPQAPDPLVESISHWEGKATAVSQLADRALCAQSRLPLPWHGAGLPWLPSLSPCPTSRGSVPATLPCPFQRTPLCLIPAPGLPGTKCWRCPFTPSRESTKGRGDTGGFLGSSPLASAAARAVLGRVGPRWGQSWRGDRR